MSKGKGRLYIRGDHQESATGTHDFTVRVPDGYRVAEAYFTPIEDQGVGHVHIEGFFPTVDTLPAVVDGFYHNAVWCRFTQTTANKGVSYMVFIEPVDGSDVQIVN